MKLTLNEVKAMNEVAGTQLTKEQEIAFIKNRLQELEFGTQKSFDTYKKSHNMRPDTKVKIAGKETTAGAASKKSTPTTKGTSVFGGDKSKASSTSSQSFTKMNSKQIQKSFEDYIEKNHPKVAEKWGDINGNIESKSGRYQLTTVQKPNKGLEVVILDTDRDDDHPEYEKKIGMAASLDKATDLYLSTLKSDMWNKLKGK